MMHLIGFTIGAILMYVLITGIRIDLDRSSRNLLFISSILVSLTIFGSSLVFSRLLTITLSFIILLLGSFLLRSRLVSSKKVVEDEEDALINSSFSQKELSPFIEKKEEIPNLVEENASGLVKNEENADEPVSTIQEIDVEDELLAARESFIQDKSKDVGSDSLQEMEEEGPEERHIRDFSMEEYEIPEMSFYEEKKD